MIAITPMNFLDHVQEEKRKAWRQGKQRQRFFWDTEQWVALDFNCQALSGPDIGLIRATPGMTFMGSKHFLKATKRKPRKPRY